ncbi:MAG: PD-(D/E)XK nuclease family protein, partial [Clostridiales bacterium]|nr:PD-(D/E)XK nuclease family protein [Clostridiales bacterium]
DTPDYEESGFRLVPKPDFLDGDRPLSRTERGIAHHLVMQFIDFSRFNTLEDIKEELNRLEQKRFLSKAQKDAVDPGKIMAFFRSSIGRRLMQSDCVRREFRFSILIKQDELFEISLDENDDSEFLLQGVIDCMFEEDGELVVLDFKTDRLKNRDVLTIAERYQKQIEAYAYAMHRITGKRVKETVLWFFDRDAAISVERKD